MEDGLAATMDSPDQSVEGVPVTSVSRSGSALVMELKQMAGKFEGKINPDLASIDGTWTQGGASAPLAAKTCQRYCGHPDESSSEPDQTLSLQGRRGGVLRTRAPASSSQPRSLFRQRQRPVPRRRPHHRSGPQDRDESLLGHKPFLVLADYLRGAESSCSRADDRGIRQVDRHLRQCDHRRLRYRRRSRHCLPKDQAGNCPQPNRSDRP